MGQDLLGLDGRVAVVTGASSGLGARFARVLVGAGARVVLAGRRVERLESLATDLGADVARAVPTDVTDPAALARLVDQAVEAFGRLDVMVNNAGVATSQPAETVEAESFRRTLDVNVAGVFYGCREAARVMLASGSGSIVNIASVAAFASAADRYPLAAYAASKGAVVSLTRELGAEWAGRGVRVNAIAPGWFLSEMTGNLEDEDQVRWIRSRTPLGRPGREDELDGALLFLAGDASSYVVGQTLVVDGGFVIDRA